jgi:hypothetical protein
MQLHHDLFTKIKKIKIEEWFPFLLMPIIVNDMLMRLIDGKPFSLFKTNPWQTRAFVSVVLLFFLFGTIYLISTNLILIKKIYKPKILGFLLFWFTSFYLHTSYFDYGTGLIGVFGSYFLCAAFQISILINLDLKK